MKTATINPAILDVHTMTQNFDAAQTEKLFGALLHASYDLELQSSSVEEFEAFNLAVYAKSAVERTTSRIAEDTMIFKTEEVVNYGKEDFLSKRFYQLRKFGQNFMFVDLSVSACIHSRGFIPVTIARTNEDEFKVKFFTKVLGEHKRVAKSAEGRDYVQTESRFQIWSDM